MKYRIVTDGNGYRTEFKRNIFSVWMPCSSNFDDAGVNWSRTLQDAESLAHAHAKRNKPLPEPAPVKWQIVKYLGEL
jgi:hypothetical protein